MSLKMRKKLSKEEIAKITKYQRNLTNELNLAQTFAEYFLVLGIDPIEYQLVFIYIIQSQTKFQSFIQMK